MSSSRYAHLPRKKQLTGIPPKREDIVVRELERAFPGSEWIEPQPASAQSSTGASPRGAAKETSTGSPSQGGAGAHTYYVVAGGKYDPQKLRKWVSKLGSEHTIVTVKPQKNKDGSVRSSSGADAIVVDARPDAQTRELRSDLFGGRAGTLAGAVLFEEAVETPDAVLVLVGTGGRVASARSGLKRVGPYLGGRLPALVELP